MPEIKNLFTQGKMNKDLDERLIPNGQYRDAMNIQVSTSEGSDVGTVQNILGNKKVENLIPGSGLRCIGSIADEKNDKIYWFLHGFYSPAQNGSGNNVDAIIEYHKDGAITPVIVDTKANTAEAVLNFPGQIVTGINIVDNLLFWTDNNSEPKKINIDRCKQGTKLDSSGNMTTHSSLVIDGEIATKNPINVTTNGAALVSSISLVLDDASDLQVGMILTYPVSVIYPITYTTAALDIIIESITGNTVTLSSGLIWEDNQELIFAETIDLKEEHITIIKKKPTKAPTFKIITTEDETVDLLFEKTFPRFSCRYKYEDGEYSAFGPFTDIVFKSNYLGDYGIDDAFTQKDTYNTGMVNIIKEIELTDFIAPDIPEDVVQVDILYKQENSNIVFSIDTIKRKDEDSDGNLVWKLPGSNQDTNYNSKYKGYYKVETENIYAAVPSNQLLRPWDNVPRKALAQEITGNRIVYGNYLQGYDFGDGPDGKPIRPDVNADYSARFSNIIGYDFNYGGIPSIKSLRNYQLGIVFGDKYGRETPVFTSSEGAFQLGWFDKDSQLSASRSYQLQASSASYFPNWADYYKIFIKETSGEYYNLAMDRAYTANKVSEELGEEDHLWISFNSSDRAKISEEDYIILKKQVGAGMGQITEDNKFKVLDIKNEAPDAVKFVLINIGTVANRPIVASTSQSPVDNETILNNDGTFGTQTTVEGIFPIATYRPTSDRDTIKMRKDTWLDNDGMKLDSSALNNEEVYFSFYRTDTSEYSKRYRVSAVNWESPYYTIKLKDPITETFAGVENTVGDPSTYFLNVNLVVKFERKATRPIDSLSGKFYVKIPSNALTSTTIEAAIGSQTIVQYLNKGTADTYWLTDVYNDTDNDPSDGIINAQTPSNPPTGTDAANSTASGHSGVNTTKTESDWAALIDSRKWFVDNMYMAAIQPNDTFDVNSSGSLWWGGGMIIPTGVGYLNRHTYWPNDPGENYENLQNGMEGFITTVIGGPHTSPGGNRRWRTSKRVTTLDDTYGPEGSGGKHFLHLSFGKCGVDLHDNTFPTTMHPGQHGTHDLNRHMQKILGGSGPYTSPSIWGSNFWRHYKTQSSGYVNVFCGNSGFTSGSNGYIDQTDDDFLNQWNPAYGGNTTENHENQRIINAISQKRSFKFTGDPTNTIYKIKSYSIKRIYNHTPWRTVYEWDGTTTLTYPLPTSGNNPSTLGLEARGVSVENLAHRWRDSFGITYVYSNTNISGAADATLEQNLKTAIYNFGKANNRRVCYILELNRDPTDPNQNGGYNPLDWSSGSNTPNQPDANTSVGIEFVDVEVDVLGAVEVKNPSIWETEPKEGVDLDIYYEASQAIPINIKEENRELFAPVGSIIEFLDNPEAKDGSFGSISNNIYLTAWNTSGGENELYLSEEINSKDTNNTDIAYDGNRVRFHRKDGSYTTAKILSMADNSLYDLQSNSYDSIKIVQEIDPDAEIGLSWYNCLSFGNGLESDRIRDDFNAMTMTNGVKASTTIEQPYQEERRKSGLIYSGLYNSTSGVNDLNQFIMAEKITKDLNPTYGSIQKLFTRRISLIAFCEDKVVGITANKDALYNADGSPELISSNAVLGDANPFAGDYGISKNPESFSKESYRAYFTDKQRGAVLRLSMDGLTPISDAGMRDYFRDNLKTAGKLIGSYDQYKKDYNLTLSHYLPENILINSTVDEGEALIEYYLPEEYLTNGNFATATDYTTSSFPSNGLLNSTFQIETNLTNHPQIDEGELQPELSYQAPDPISASTGDPVFHAPMWEVGGANVETIYEWDKDDGDPLDNSNTGAPPQYIHTDAYNANGGNYTVYWGGTNNGIYWRNPDSNWDNALKVGWDDDGTTAFDPFDEVSYTNPNTSTTYNIGDITPTTLNTAPTGFQESIASKHGGKNNTFYNGEEFKLDIRAKSYSASYGYYMYVKIYDGDVLIDNAKISSVGFITDPNEFLPDGTTSNPNYQDPLTPFGSYSSSVTPSGNDHGYITSNTYESNNFSTTSSNNQTQKFRWKFTDPTDPTGDGIVVNNLRVAIRFEEYGSYTDYLFCNKIVMKKFYRIKEPGFSIPIGAITPEVPAQDPIPLADVLPWVEVEHNIDPWTSNGTPESWNLFGVAETNFGPQLPAVTETATAGYDQGSYTTGDTISWVIPDSSVTTTSATPTFWDGTGTAGTGQYADGIQISDGYADKHTVNQNGHVIQDLTVPGGFGSLFGDNWYELTCTYTAKSGGDILVSNVLDPSTTAGSTPSGHIGVVSSDYINLIMDDDNNGNLKARWKQSTDSSSNFDELKILGDNVTAVIDNIELRDISTPPSGGDVTDWSMNGNMDIRNHYAYKNVYHDSGKVTWVNGGAMRVEPDGDGQQSNIFLSQSFGNFDDTTNTLPPSEDGYKLKFTISNHTSGKLEGYIYGAGVSDGSGGYIATGFDFSDINANGDWVVIGKMDGTNVSIEKDGVAAGSIIGNTDVTTQGNMNKVSFGAITTSVPAFNGSINNITITDTTNYFIAGDVGNWVISGFDKTLEEYIVWNSTGKYIEFNNAPEESMVDGVLTPLTVRQNINRNFYEGETYNLKFNVKSYSGSGAIKGYFYNHLGKGFTFEVDDSNFTNSTSYYFNKQFVIGVDDSAVLDSNLLRGSLVIIVDSGPFTANLDNFVLQQEFPEFVPTTITYSEDVKGWVSFKSFVPESGLSVSSNYYTFRGGGLFQHHINETRNWFYGDLDSNSNPDITESSLTAVINTEPSLVKIFNTLNYEGSQSKVDQYVTDSSTSLTNAEIYNLTGKDGWYVDYIKTNKQEGNLNEFIEKEGKWFNYIKGKNNVVDASALSFQGIGVVFSITYPQTV